MLKWHNESMYILLSFIFSLLPIGQSYGVDQSQPKSVKLKVISSPYLSYAPFFIAYEEGFFTEHGLQVDFLNMVDANQAMPSLISGDLDVMAYMILPGPLNAMARGAKIKFVADKGHLSPSACVYTALLVRRVLVESGRLSSPFDLKDLRVAMYEGPSPMGYFMEKILDQGGLTLNDIKNVSVPVSARVEAFERGTIDATLFSEPWVTHLVQGGHAVIRLPIQQLVPNFQLAYLMYGPSLLEKKPDAGKRFMVAYLQAVRQYNQGKTEKNLKILAKHTGIDQELLKKMCWPAVRNDGQFNVESVLNFQQWAQKRGYLDHLLTEKEFWDSSFIDYANKVLRTTTK